MAGRSKRCSKVGGKVSLTYAVPNSRRWNLSQQISTHTHNLFIYSWRRDKSMEVATRTNSQINQLDFPSQDLSSFYRSRKDTASSSLLIRTVVLSSLAKAVLAWPLSSVAYSVTHDRSVQSIEGKGLCHSTVNSTRQKGIWNLVEQQ